MLNKNRSRLLMVIPLSFEEVLVGSVTEAYGTEASSSIQVVQEEVVSDLNSEQSWFQNLWTSALHIAIRVAVAFVVFFVISKILGRLLKILDGYLEKRGVERSVRAFVVSILQYGVLGFVLVSIIVQLDIVEASTIAALIASAGVGISLAMQGVLSNLAGGILLLILRPFRTGDYITIPSENVEGTVLKIEMYYTTIEKLDKQVIMIPNSTLTNEPVINMSLSDDRRLEIKIGVSYNSDLEKVKGVLKDLVDSETRLKKDDRSFFVDSFDESCITVAFRAHVKNSEYWSVKWDMNEKIKERFEREGIEIPYNQMDVHIKNG